MMMRVLAHNVPQVCPSLFPCKLSSFGLSGSIILCNILYVLLLSTVGNNDTFLSFAMLLADMSS